VLMPQRTRHYIELRQELAGNHVRRPVPLLRAAELFEIIYPQ